MNQHARNREFGFLDLAATFTERWKALLILPLLAGLIVFLALWSRPPVYAAEALIDAKPEQIIRLSQPAVLDPVLRSGSTVAQDEETIAGRRRLLLANLTVTPVPQSSLYRVTLSGGPSASEVSDKLKDIIQGFVRGAVPAGQKKAALEDDLKFLDQRMAGLMTGLQRYSSSDDKAAFTTSGPPPLIAYWNEIKNTRDQIAEKRIALDGLTWDRSVVQPPISAVQPPPNRLLYSGVTVIAILGLLAFAFTLLALHRHELGHPRKAMPLQL